MVEDARIDPMTGLMTRLPFLEVLQTALQSRKSFCVALLDIDHFMRVNEELGISAGDRVIKALGLGLASWAEENQWVVARIAGDEFGIYLPGLPLEKAFLKLEELRRFLCGPEFFQSLGDMGEIGTFGVCIGVANYPRDAKDPAALMRMADEALYAAKEGSRDCVALPTSQQEMVLKSCHYSVTQLRRLKALAEKTGDKESVLLREALDDLLKKHDVK